MGYRKIDLPLFQAALHSSPAGEVTDFCNVRMASRSSRRIDEEQETITTRSADAFQEGTVCALGNHSSSGKNIYIQFVTLNGEFLNCPWLPHSAIAGGGVFVLDIASKPNRNWGSAPKAAPPSMDTIGIEIQSLSQVVESIEQQSGLLSGERFAMKQPRSN